MTERLKFLIEKNQAARMKSERFASFVASLSPHVDFLPQSIEYASFEETKALLEEVRRIAGRSPTLSWNIYDQRSFGEAIDCIRGRLLDEPCELVLSAHFEFVGALRVRLDTALRNIGGFFAIGEETLLVSDLSRSNFIVFDLSENRVENTSEYFVRVGGSEWSNALRSCFDSRKL